MKELSMNVIKTAVIILAFSLASATAQASTDVENQVELSRVSVDYEQPFYILKGAAKNTSEKTLTNVQMKINVYEHGRVVDSITAIMKSLEPGETVRWQSPTTKTFSKYMVSNIIAE
ncbi:hypothetical protein C3D80_20175 [Cronobacter sakazakii]|nr:hypothetical protein [Cronobacter sakazakii]EMC4401974.1 hypothetical protein [Cronobacter sakazakii]KAB0805788.1 hypothetical protein FZI15_22315 [Cronobacter sakazakii]KAB0887856.1 hypothetical protein FZI07_20985 [Cronobacter sakazakii]KAB0900843.1 hypothetical protein FZI05_19475 [Cronobacter sakazakii]